MILLILILLLVAGWQLPLLYNQKKYREMVAFIVLWLVSGIYGGIVVMDIPLISPFEIITNTITTITNSIK